VCDAQSTPTEEELLQGACRNPDGFGFAIMAGDKIISERTMSAKKSIRRFLELRKQYPEAYALWHCRIATQGVRNEGNCHPFAVGGDTQTYLAHNGVLSVPMAEGDRRSDTRVFAEEILPAMGGVSALDNYGVFHILEKWATGSKIVVMTVDPSAKSNLYILNEKAGEWDNDGVWWSNTYHRPAPPAKNYYGGRVIDWRDDRFYDTHRYDYSVNQYVEIDTKAVVLAPKALTTPSTNGDNTLDHLFSDEIADERWEPFICDFCELAIEQEDLSEMTTWCPNCQACFDCGDAQGYCLCYEPPPKRIALGLTRVISKTNNQPTKEQ
jgi:glutamine amidotransferase